jgi:superfamily II DNA/RNA helicase
MARMGCTSSSLKTRSKLGVRGIILAPSRELALQVSLHVIGLYTSDNNDNNSHAYAVKLNSFTHVRALLLLHDRDIDLAVM